MESQPLFQFIHLDWREICESLSARGFYSAPALTEQTRRDALEIAKRVQYKKLDPVTDDGRVKQDMSIAYCPFDNSELGQLAVATKSYVEGLFSTALPETFKYPLNFNETLMQHYSIGGGISPHIDGVTHIKYRNLVVLFVLEGRGDLFTCTDYEGSGAQKIDTTPGNIILMPADGFHNFTDTPLHYLAPVTTERYVFALRQAYITKNGGRAYDS